MMSLALSVVLILLSVLFLNNEKVVEAADERILLENRHPGYWNYLSPGHGKTIDIPPADSENLLISDIKNQTINGITIIVNEDRSLTLSGTDTSEVGFNLVLGNVFLPDGEYYISDGIDIHGANMYVWSNELSQSVAYGSSASFNIDNSASTYQCGIHIDSEAMFNNVTIYPMISKAGDSQYGPYSTSETCTKALVFEMDKNAISADDMRVFQKSINQYEGYNWITIKYPDGTGIQWKDGIKTEGFPDIWGRI